MTDALAVPWRCPGAAVTAAVIFPVLWSVAQAGRPLAGRCAHRWYVDGGPSCPPGSPFARPSARGLCVPWPSPGRLVWCVPSCAWCLLDLGGAI